MLCPLCGYANPADAVLCQKCGARLEAACPGCRTGNRPSAKFCKNCGQQLPGMGTGPAPSNARSPSPDTYTPKHLAEKILMSRSALEGELKQVTVLFADIADSSLVAERIGPEGMYVLLTGC